MISQQQCDFCGLTQQTLPQGLPDESTTLEMDAVGLWACQNCQSLIISNPSEIEDEGYIDPLLPPLIGKNAGAICYTLNLPFRQPYIQIIEAVSIIGYDNDHYMSTWTFVTLLADGSTVWQSQDRTRKALVEESGNVRIDII
jgi:hypothetical protein